MNKNGTTTIAETKKEPRKKATPVKEGKINLQAFSAMKKLRWTTKSRLQHLIDIKEIKREMKVSEWEKVLKSL